MAQRPEDFTLPMAAIKKILQDSMPKTVNVSETAKLALSKAACIFILYLTTAANGFSQDNSRKRILGKDVIEALTDLDLGFMVPTLQGALAEHHKNLLSKKQSRSSRKEKKKENVEDVEMDGNDLEVGEEVIIIDSGSESEAEEHQSSESFTTENSEVEEET